MLTSEEILARIQEKESKARSLKAKLWGQQAELKTTESLANNKIMQDYGDEAIISPAPWTTLFLILFLSNLIFLGYVLGRDMNKEPLVIKAIFGVFFSLVFVGTVTGLISIYFFGKQLNGPININNKGMKLRNRSYEWKDIVHTCLVKQPQTRGFKHWLVIGLQDGTVDRYDLTQFTSIKDWLGLDTLDVKIATAIEYYKQNQK